MEIKIIEEIKREAWIKCFGTDSMKWFKRFTDDRYTNVVVELAIKKTKQEIVEKVEKIIKKHHASIEDGGDIVFIDRLLDKIRKLK